MNSLDRLIDVMILSPATPTVTFALGWFVGGTLLDLAFHRGRVRFYAPIVALLGVGLSAPVALWFGWARHRLWHADGWTDPPQSFPYPDALLLEWMEALTVPPPPGFLDINSGFYALDLRLFPIVAGCWCVVGAFVGLALPPRWILAVASHRATPVD